MYLEAKRIYKEIHEYTVFKHLHAGFETWFGWGCWGQTTGARGLTGAVGTPGTQDAGILYAQDTCLITETVGS